jgi:hypothetical protein
VYDETGGRPFFMLETLRGLLEEGVLGLQPADDGGWTLDIAVALKDPERLQGAVPARVQAAIRERMSQLSPTAKELLAAGAMLDTRFTFEQLCRVAEMAERDALAALDEVMQACMLQEEATGQYMFSHHSLREAVYAQAGAARRQVLDRRARAMQGGSYARMSATHHVPGSATRSATTTERDRAGGTPDAAFSVARAHLDRASIRLVATPVLAAWHQPHSSTTGASAAQGLATPGRALAPLRFPGAISHEDSS